MDTKLKKYNSSFIKKVIAIILCLLCVFGCALQSMTSLYACFDADINEDVLKDAIFYSSKKDVTETESFRNEMGRYIDSLSYMLGSFGDATEENYQQWKKLNEEKNSSLRSRAKKNLIDHVVHDAFYTYLQLVEDKVVVPLGFLEGAAYSGNTYGYEENDIKHSYADYYQLLLYSADSVYSFSEIPESVQSKAKELGADGVFEINNIYNIVSRDYQNDKDIVKESFQPGYYAFKIDTEAFDDVLVRYGMLYNDEYSSYENFKKSYDNCLKEINKEYCSGRYYIKDGSGKVYTNVPDLSEKSTRDEVEEYFSKVGYYSQGDRSGTYYTADGAFLFHTEHNSYEENEYYTTPNVVTTFDNDSIETTVLPETTTVTYNQQSTTMLPARESTDPTQEVTSAVVIMPTTRIDYTGTDETPFINEGGEEYICFVGVDMYSEYPETDALRSISSDILYAREVLLDWLLTCGLLAVVLLCAFIYLVTSAGRRKGEKEAYLMKTDKIFTDWRIILNALFCWVAFSLMIMIVDFLDGYEEMEMPFAYIFSFLVSLMFASVLDLVLFVARHIKNKSLLKNLFPVWLLKKCFKLYKEKLRPFADEKLLYTKEFKKGTIIRIGAVVIVNIAFAFFGAFESMRYDTFFLWFLLMVFDLAVLVWVLRFIAGVEKIFSALDEIKEGNYNVQINAYALPGSLRETAGKVMGLRDGLKAAVDEAVKQEQTKTELITNVSHDLKTPLTSIINYVELLKKCEINDEAATEYLGVLGEKSDRLKKLIEDLVEASKASTGNMKVELISVSLKEMVNQLLGEHSDSLEKKKLSIITEMPEREVTVSADGKLLYRVMENLIVNIEKYSLYGTRVYLSVKEEGGFASVTFKNISEQPLNISADELKERFVRGDEARSTEGNGLGLSIAQSLCTVQGGELEISISGDLFTAKIILRK